MKKEDILKSAQHNKIINDEYEQSIRDNCDLISLIIGLLVAVILCMFEFFALHSINLPLLAVIFTAGGISLLLNGFKLRKIIQVIIGTVLLVLDFSVIVLYIIKVILL